MPSTPVWFITGVSSGFGQQLALRALNESHFVIGSVRNRAAKTDAVKLIIDRGGQIVEMDLTDSAANIDRIIKAAEGIYGQIDYLVNNAGYATMGPVERITAEELSKQLSTNLFGPLFTIQAVLPGMRSRKSGVIVNLSSVAGVAALPVSGCYCASKFALEGISESLTREVAEFGISVLIVEPGAFRTNFMNATKRPERSLGTDYNGTFVERYTQRLEEMTGEQWGDSTKGAHRMFEVISGVGAGGQLKGKVLRLPIGMDAIGLVETKIQSLNNDVALAKVIEQEYSTAIQDSS